MRLLLSAFLMLATMVPGASYAYTNSLELMASAGAGDYEAFMFMSDADVSLAEYGLNVTHYFSEIRSNGEPYGERVFLQHPSQVATELSGMKREITSGQDTWEIESEKFGVSGIYYFPNNRTGLGLAIEGTARSSRVIWGGIPMEEEQSIAAARLSIRHYVADWARIGLVLSGESVENKGTAWEVFGDAPGLSLREIYGDALLESKFKLSAYIAEGELKSGSTGPAAANDVTMAGLLAGIYLSKTTGLFLSFQNLHENSATGTQKASTTSLAVDHYFSEAGHCEISIANWSVEKTGWRAGDLAATILSLRMGFLF